ncbi:succinylglutamate desuccinylase/aspartoacylase family protein, partial [Candidatus Bathyarchaeota archaeon]|nr:succinylglutamate desuccinylase/aspartoacylase family protein [Candidatus Bathyarchaeota archaeon]
GILVLVPVVNTEGFHARKPYSNQLDHLNQNKVFPGDPEGSMTRRVAHAVFDSFVSKSDYLVDCHSADLGEDATHGMFIYRTDDEDLTNKMTEMARCFDCDYIGTTEISGNTGEAVRLYGIPCIMTESGAPYPIREDDVLYHYMGLRNLMRHIGMMDEEAALGDQRVDPPTQRVHAKSGGLWRRKVEAGQRVKEGELLGIVSDLHGETLQVATAPLKGVVSFLRVHYSVNEGDTLCWVTET